LLFKDVIDEASFKSSSIAETPEGEEEIDKQPYMQKEDNSSSNKISRHSTLGKQASFSNLVPADSIKIRSG